MSEVIERAARAAFECWDFPCRRFDSLSSDDQEHWREIARAAIEAMREPTPEMLGAGWPHTADPCWVEDVRKAWGAMIDAALKEPDRPD